MRTTVDINPDLLARVRKLADAEGISFKEALNRTITRGLAPAPVAAREPFRQQTFDLGGHWDAKTMKEFLHAAEMERYLKTTRRSPNE